MELRNMNEAEAFKSVLNSCTGSVWMVSTLTGRHYDMKNEHDQLLSMGKMLSGNGRDMEIYADTRADQSRIMNFMVEQMAA